ncbi:MAG: undecaprenyl diphosphate synthase [Acidimicrobiales bacterium]|jgi:undecaprenyl diphosphate synthase
MEKQSLHVGIIMDGNGRWAVQQGKQRLEGHAAGATTMLNLIKESTECGVHTFTVFAFAIANWKRDNSEVDGLWVLFIQFLEANLQELIDDGVCFRLIGDRGGLPANVLAASIDAENRSEHNDKTVLQIALNYDGVDEVARMTKGAMENGISVEDIDTTYVRSHLDTQVGNEPDILIRTGMPEACDGMSVWRGSGFLPVQSAESVCVSTETLWPDFTPEHLKKIIAYAKPKDRLFGGQR